MNICLIGSTGVIGSEVLNILNQSHNINEIKTLTRKKVIDLKSKENNLQIEFDQMSDLKNSVKADVFICCLGSTIKNAGSKENFEKVDFQYVLNFGKLAELNHAKKLIVVSALGANSKSKIFYNQVKGKMEDALLNLNIPSIDIFQPSLLLGERKESRPGETIAKIISPMMNPFLIGSLKKYRGIQSKSVALAISKRVFITNNEKTKFESDQIQNIADAI